MRGQPTLRAPMHEFIGRQVIIEPPLAEGTHLVQVPVSDENERNEAILNACLQIPAPIGDKSSGRDNNVSPTTSQLEDSIMSTHTQHAPSNHDVAATQAAVQQQQQAALAAQQPAPRTATLTDVVDHVYTMKLAFEAAEKRFAPLVEKKTFIQEMKPVLQVAAGVALGTGVALGIGATIAWAMAPKVVPGVPV